MASKDVTLPITGMTCANCALSIERNLKKLQGVEETNVNFASEQASVSFDPELIDIDELIKKVEDVGYGIATAKVELPITGMTCANCALNIERTLNKKVPGVVKASVNFASERAAVQYLPNLTSVEEMIAAIRQAGYDAIPPDETGECGGPKLPIKPESSLSVFSSPYLYFFGVWEEISGFWVVGAMLFG